MMIARSLPMRKRLYTKEAMSEKIEVLMFNVLYCQVFTLTLMDRYV